MHSADLLSGRQDGTPFYSMKFAEGGPLSVRIENYRTNHMKRRADREARPRDAYGARRGILHRDLKPEIFSLTVRQPVLSDFGLAEMGATEMRSHANTRDSGTPLYMAPEQARTRAPWLRCRCVVRRFYTKC